MLPGGWLRTGDGGSFDADGYLYLHDRLKDMIVTGGENVYPAEVESVMTGHPAVAEVAVVGVPSAQWGESPYAVVVLRPGAEVSEADLIAWTRDRLAHFKCPAGVSFVSSLARTASGKLQKQAIRASLSSAPRPLAEGISYGWPFCGGEPHSGPHLGFTSCTICIFSRSRPALKAWMGLSAHPSGREAHHRLGAAAKSTPVPPPTAPHAPAPSPVPRPAGAVMITKGLILSAV